MDMGEGRRERLRCMESNMETYNSVCKIDSQWEFALWLRELKQGLCDNLEWWDGSSEGRGRECTYDWFLSMFDRKQQNSVKDFILQLKPK